ncbi:dual 3',5'-cyclic-AMP and -GMP phosphodiesterase 11A-like [Amphiura filiformis]|uniref:dual 3',5'-cyclic-AMP and -GMP phosphodiesterase 11A-like n=1 Tax=Amphiura filiformis TaxID=82378 RepID=UPI003B217778
MAGSSNFIETWLDSNPEWFEDYFVRNGNRTMVQKWTEKQSLSKGPANAHIKELSSPVEMPLKKHPPLSDHDEKGDIFPIEESSILNRPRSGSRQYLRQDFAKTRSKTVFHTWGSPSSNLENLTSLDQRDTGPTSPPSSDYPARAMGRRGQLRRASTVPPERHAVSMLSVLLEPKVRLPHRISITNEDKIRLREKCNEREFFLALVKDISHDLDLNFLKEKIVSNVCILVSGSHCALFLLEGPRGREKLVYKPPSSRNNDWNNSNNDEGVKIAVGESLVGGVAESGLAVLVEKPDEGLPYLKDAESVIGYKVDSLMCMPIRNSEDDVIGVALVLNKTSGKAFTEDDEKVLETYLTFCGIGISNAQLFDTYMKEYDRNRKLLEVAHDLFEEQTCLDNVVQKIMQRAQSLLKCERCSVMLVKDPNAEEVTFSKVFDLPSSLHNGHTNPTKAMGDVKVSNGIIEQVALTGDTINIYDAQKDPRFDKELDKAMGFHTKSILCMPIRDNKYQIIGKLLDKAMGFHTKSVLCMPIRDNKYQIIGKLLDKAMGFHTKSILCMPIRDNKYQIIGKLLDKAMGFHTKSILCMPIRDNKYQIIGTTSTRSLVSY